MAFQSNKENLQDHQVITTGQQNDLARRFPFWFDPIPDRVPNNLLFGAASDYDLENQAKLEDVLKLKGQEVEQVHENGTEYQKQTVLSSYFIQKRHKELQAKRNWKARKQAGAVRPGSLGIVGSNLDTCNTEPVEKETRAHLYRAQNMIQKIRLGIDVEDYEFKIISRECNTNYQVKSNTLWPCPQVFEEIPLKNPIVSKTVCDCGKPLGPMVELQRSKQHGSGSVNGVATCGSVWACPVCRNRIISERAEELKEIYNAWKERDGHLTMVTLTAPHNKGDNLAELYGSNAQGTGMTGALGKFRSSRDFAKIFKERVGYFGDVRAVEVTWGRQNGFHPHIHMLILTEYTYCFKEWKHRFYKVWRQACLESGLQEPSWEHGIDITYIDDDEKAQYPAKWGAANEIVSDAMKQAKKGNFAISELERCLFDKEYRKARKMGLKQTASVLRAYYGAMKGQRMLQTGGIGPDGSWKKELLEIEDEQEEETHVKVCDLDYYAYIKIKRSGKLPDLLQVFEAGETDQIRISNVKGWLKNNGFDPDLVKETANGPPPSCFSYGTETEEKFYRDIMAKSNPEWQN